MTKKHKTLGWFTLFTFVSFGVANTIIRSSGLFLRTKYLKISLFFVIIPLALFIGWSAIVLAPRIKKAPKFIIKLIQGYGVFAMVGLIIGYGYVAVALVEEIQIVDGVEYVSEHTNIKAHQPPSLYYYRTINDFFKVDHYSYSVKNTNALPSNL